MGSSYPAAENHCPKVASTPLSEASERWAFTSKPVPFPALTTLTRAGQLITLPTATQTLCYARWVTWLVSQTTMPLPALHGIPEIAHSGRARQLPTYLHNGRVPLAAELPQCAVQEAPRRVRRRERDRTNSVLPRHLSQQPLPVLGAALLAGPALTGLHETISSGRVRCMQGRGMMRAQKCSLMPVTHVHELSCQWVPLSFSAGATRTQTRTHGALKGKAARQRPVCWLLASRGQTTARASLVSCP